MILVAGMFIVLLKMGVVMAGLLIFNFMLNFIVMNWMVGMFEM